MAGELLHSGTSVKKREGKTVFNLSEQSTAAQIAYSHIFLEPIFSENISPKLQYLILRMMDKNHRSRANVEEIENIIHSRKIPELKEYLSSSFSSNNIELHSTLS